MGVRLDPIIKIEAWEKYYQEMVAQILSLLNSSQIDYISIGTPKHNKILFETIKKRFPTSPTILGEMFPSNDGKYKYLKFQRVDIYKKMISWIREYCPDIRIDVSIESEEVKELVFN